ncbi:hypothetical protein LguiA_018361 [Lonicera macranthoides]
MKDNLVNVLAMSQAEDHSEYSGHGGRTKPAACMCCGGLGICFQNAGKRF